MPAILNLDHQKFLGSLTVPLLERYLARFWADHPKLGLAAFNRDFLNDLLTSRENEEIAAVILGEFQQIIEVAKAPADLLLRVHRRHGLAYDPEARREQLAMELFVDHPDAFDYARTRLGVFSSAAKLSVHHIDNPKVAFPPEHRQAFGDGVTEWFRSQAKGNHTLVDFFDDEGEVLVLVKRGKALQTEAYWNGPTIAVRGVRPVVEDVLWFDPASKLLRIKTSLAADCKEYVRLWCAQLVGQPTLAQQALDTEVFTLAPFQTGAFDYAGDGTVVQLTITEVRLRLFGVTDPVITIKAANVMETIRHDLGSVAIDRAVWLSVKLRAVVVLQGEKPQTVTFEITPPLRTHIGRKRYEAVIERFLEGQGIKVR